MPESAPKVAVDLERRVGIEQIQVRAAAVCVIGPRAVDRGELFADQLISVIAIVQARPTIDLPCLAPTGAGIATQFETLADGVRELGRAERRDLTPRMQRE